MEKKAFKTLLRSIKNEEYKVPEGIEPYILSLEMMDYMGDVDGEMRNDLAFDILVEWIMTDVLTAEEARKIYFIALDEERILKGLGEVDDTVFDRSFCVEIVACITYKHKKFLVDSDILKAFEIVLKMFNEDKDVRGYVEGKSWAHGAAHGADALAELAQCSVIGYEGLKDILKAIHKKINIYHYGYINNEDERMINAVKEVLARDIIPTKEVEEWVNSFANIKKQNMLLPDDLFVEHNVTLFLKSLYFRLDNTKHEQMAEVVKEVLKNTSRFGEDHS